MEIKFLVYRTDTDEEGGSCSSESDLMRYLHPEIIKFSYKHGLNIGFHSDEVLEGDILVDAHRVLEQELKNLVENYHIDANPKGFSRSALKITILNKKRVLNHFSSQIDQIIYSLNSLVNFLEKVIKREGKVLIYGFGNIDVLDCNLIWVAKNLIGNNHSCSLEDLEKEIGYIFYIDNLIIANPNIFTERVIKLNKKGYLTLDKNNVGLTSKGKEVNVWTNFIVKTVTIDKEQLKTFANIIHNP